MSGFLALQFLLIWLLLTSACTGPETAAPRTVPEGPWAEPQKERPASTGALEGDDRSSPPRLSIPVLGVTVGELYDSFGDPRSGGRRHEGIDIHAPRHTPVLAAADGTILRLSNSPRGGRTVHQLDGSRRFVYYYAHLEAIDPRLREGRTVRRGERLGSVGTSGNAPDSAPHLHFSIEAIEDSERWWQGRPVNPFPLLRFAED